MRGLGAASGGAGHRGADGDGTGSSRCGRNGFREGARPGGSAGPDTAADLNRGDATLGWDLQAGQPLRPDAARALRPLRLETLAKRTDRLGRMLATKDRRVVVVALAARLARAARALLTSGQKFGAQMQPAPVA